MNYPKPIENFRSDFPKVHKDFYIALTKTDILFVANENKNDEKGYIGPGVFAEIAFSVGLNLAQDKDIEIILNQIPNKNNVFYNDIKLWLDLNWIKLYNK